MNFNNFYQMPTIDNIYFIQKLTLNNYPESQFEIKNVLKIDRCDITILSVCLKAEQTVINVVKNVNFFNFHIK